MSTQQELEALLADMAALLDARDLGPIDLYLLGGCSLILYDDRAGATKDLDVVEEGMRASDAEAATALIDAFGRSSGRAPWLDPVPAGLPPLPLGWAVRAVPRSSPSERVRLWTLDFADLIVTKLRRWHPRDRADVRHVCDRHPELRDRLAALSAASFFEIDWWEETMAARRDRVLDYLDGRIDEV